MWFEVRWPMFRLAPAKRRLALLICALLSVLAVWSASVVVAAPPAPDGMVTKELRTDLDQVLPQSDSQPAVATTGGLQPEEIIGPDDRWRVSPTTELPARAIAMITTYNSNFNENYSCTGTYIGPDVVLTSADCLRHSPDVVAIRVAPGFDRGEVFGHAWAKRYYYPRDWSTQLGTNWGMLIMYSKELGEQVGWLRVAAFTDSTLRSPYFMPEIAGYSGGTLMEANTPSFYGVGPKTLDYLIDTDQQHTPRGGAVRRASDDTVVGVDNRNLTMTHNRGSRITPDIVVTMENICLHLGCSFDYDIDPSLFTQRTYLPLTVMN